MAGPVEALVRNALTSCTTFPRGDVVTPAPVPWSTYWTRDVVASKAGIVVVAPDPAR
ncbi:hypothetical protein [Methylobacterium oryzae]|uniref:hypothetical protein n=1 Tax=Methylobacterium oryzae TaxID=334852 RepID=UPI002F35D187